MTDYLITEFGAACDGTSNDAPAIQRAIDACTGSGGGRVVVPSGKTSLCGSITLKANVELHLERGSRLVASPHQADFVGHAFGSNQSEGLSWIYAEKSDGIGITGAGEIDGRAKQYSTREDRYIWRMNNWRPHMIVLVGCNHITVRDVTLRDAANWALHLSGCVDVVIHGIRILNDLKVPNCDGIDPDHCRQVRISDCHVEAGDDCIVIKNRAEFREYGPSEDITVTNCTLISTSAAVKLGTESVDAFRRIVISNCTISRSHRGLAIQLRDEGDIEDVLFSDCVVETRNFFQDWWGMGEPIYCTAVPRRDGHRLGRIRGVTYRNIRCKGENGIVVYSPHDGHIHDVTFDDVRVELNKFTGHPGGKLDRRPCAEPGLIPHEVSGFHLERAHGVRLRHCRVAWAGDPAQRPSFYGPAITARDTTDLDLMDFTGEAARPGVPARRIG